MKLLCGEREYEVTEEDRLWLLRAVAREGKDHNQVAQALVNGFACLHSRKPRSTPTLTWWVRAYAQPVNPRWFPDGRIFKKWHARDPKKYPLKAAKRRQTVYSTATKFSPHIHRAVTRALTEGPLDIPANCTDYAASWIDASGKYASLSSPRKGFNRLWTRSAGWRGYSVLRVPEAKCLLA